MVLCTAPTLPNSVYVFHLPQLVSSPGHTSYSEWILEHINPNLINAIYPSLVLAELSKKFVELSTVFHVYTASSLVIFCEHPRHAHKHAKPKYILLREQNQLIIILIIRVGVCRPAKQRRQAGRPISLSSFY